MAVQSEVKRQYVLVAIAAVVFLVIVGYVALSYTGKQADAPSHLARVKPVGKGSKSEETQQYKAVLNQFNEKHAEAAKKDGKSYISALSTTEAEPLQAPTRTPAQTPAVSPTLEPTPLGATGVERSVPAHYQSTSGDLPAYVVGSRQLSKDEMASMRAILTSWADSSIIPATVTPAEGFAASLSNVPQYGATVPVADTQAAAAAVLSRKIVPDYARTYAILQTSIDTDENSLVTVYVPAGPFEGMQLFASGYKRLNNTVDMTFDAMVWKGHSYRVNAKPIDLDSQRSNLAGEVRHHYFSRIVLPALASGLGATGNLFAEAGQQTVVTPQGGVITSSPTSPAVRNIAGTFVGGIGQTSGQVLTQEASQIPIKQVLVKRGQTIGIQFIGPVLASDDLAIAKGGVSADASPAENQVTGSVMASPGRRPVAPETPATNQ